MGAVRLVLISTYELGRQPFGLASPAAWLRAAGHEVTCADLSREPLPREAVAAAGLVAFFLPMHTATRLFLRVLERIREINPAAHLCCYGLYAPLNREMLQRLGVGTVLGGEFEEPLADFAARLESGAGGRQREPLISLARQRFLPPDRDGLPPLAAYAQLVTPQGTRRVAYTEASRGCRHLCRHCPVVPVYKGAFRVVQREVVLEDIRRQVAAGAGHVTFGDPDFFNGPGHAAAIVEALHAEWPALSYDVTVKVEHLLEHRRLLPVLARTGCAFVTSAVESLDDAVLEKLAKGHTRAGFEEALELTRNAGLPLSPTFLPFTPWATREGYLEFLRAIAGLGIIDQVAPIQLAIRLLIPEGSLLLDLREIRELVDPFDPHALVYPWCHPDPGMDSLCTSLQRTIKSADRRMAPRSQTFREIWDLAAAGPFPVDVPTPARATIPYLTEPWYC